MLDSAKIQKKRNVTENQEKGRFFRGWFFGEHVFLCIVLECSLVDFLNKHSNLSVLLFFFQLYSLLIRSTLNGIH